MAAVQRAPLQDVAPSHPRSIPERNAPLQVQPPTTVAIPPASSATRIRNSHLALDTFSPVNQNGSFEFDRVLKSGYVQKRTRKTKAWKPIFLVLRPNLLSIYKDQNEDKLRHKIHLADLTAVAFLKDPKQKRQNMFGLFSPSRNYHLEAKTRKDAEEWVELLRKEARIEEEEEEMFLASPSNVTGTYGGLEQTMQKRLEHRLLQDERLGSSSPEPADPVARSGTNSGIRRPSHTIEYSGNELASHSDFSDPDTAARVPGASTTSIPEDFAVQAPTTRPLGEARNISQLSGFNIDLEPERIVWQGYLLYLKATRGVRQWKDLWAVLRPRNLALYKNDSEYSPVLIIPLSSVINAVEIDPLSRTKVHCLQVITEEKSYKFCAHDEDALDKSLGAFKSLLAKRKEMEQKTQRSR